MTERSIKIRRADIIIIAVILTAASVLYFVFKLTAPDSPPGSIVVRQNGAVILQLSRKEMNDGIYDFRFDKGIGKIEVKDGKVRMLPMDKSICPLSICSKTGWIDGYPGAIICLPNRLSVSFVYDKSSKADGVSY